VTQLRNDLCLIKLQTIFDFLRNALSCSRLLVNVMCRILCKVLNICVFNYAKKWSFVLHCTYFSSHTLITGLVYICSSSRTLTFVNVTNINRLEDLILVWFFTMNTMTGSTWMIFLYTRYETKLQHTHIQITIQHRIKYIFLNLYRYRYPTLNFSSFRLEFDYFAPEFIEASINILTLIFFIKHWWFLN